MTEGATPMTRNEAAETTLRVFRDVIAAVDEHANAFGVHAPKLLDPKPLLDAALAEERRLVVAQIREKVEALERWDKRTVPGGFHVRRSAVLNILDEVAGEFR